MLLLKRLGVASLMIPISVMSAWAAGPCGAICLDQLEAEIEREFKSVKSITLDEFDVLRHGPNVVVFDVREPAEVAVSRIPGGILLPPDTSAAAFQSLYGADLAGKSVYLYCAVGLRSARMAKRLDATVKQSGGVGAFNVKGGVFAWHNRQRQLETTTATTDAVHGYSRRWGERYLTRRDKAVYTGIRAYLPW
jgi:rhodanese-related sulfurtransferase